MRKYETLILLSPELGSESSQQVLDTLTSIIGRENGQMIKLDDWGMRELAYPVRKHMRGHFVRLEFAAPAPVIAELERNIRITDGIYKFVTVKLADTYAPESGETAVEAPAEA